MTGQTFHRLTVLSDEPSVGGKSRIQCRCECGNVFITMAQSVRRGLTTSCGCLQQEKLTQGLRLKHGHTGTPEYAIWKGMKSRCYNPHVKSYKDYGAQGITVCDEWRNDFEQFLKDMGHRPSPQHSIERDNLDAPYCASNCRWATKEEQMNNMRNNRRIAWAGETHTLAEWCRKYDKPYLRTQSRLNKGWNLSDALFVSLPNRPAKRGFTGS